MFEVESLLRISLVGVVASTALLISSCTPDKAQALLASVKAFKTSSEEALDAAKATYVNEGTRVGSISLDEKFDNLYNEVNIGSPVRRLDTILPILVDSPGRTSGESSGSDFDHSVQALRDTLDALSVAYASLPQGSFLGARYVPCGRHAVRRVTHDLAILGKELNSQIPLATNVNRHYTSFIYAAQAGNRDIAKSEFNAMMQAMDAAAEQQAKTARLLLKAINHGKELDKVLHNYNRVSVNSILATVQYTYDYANSLKGVSTQTQMKQLNKVATEIEKDPHWSAASKYSIAWISTCPQQVAAITS